MRQFRLATGEDCGTFQIVAGMRYAKLTRGTQMLLGALWCFVGAGMARGGEALPEAGTVTNRMIQRAQAVASGDQKVHYTYAKRTVFEELNSKDETTEKTEKLYRMVLIAGVPFERLVQIKGRDLTAEEIKKEDEREKKFREKISATDKKLKLSRKEGWVTADLLRRFDFTVRERVQLNGRPTLVLDFRPKQPPVATKTVQDKLLNAFQGTLWVDEAEAETVKLAVSLRESVSLGFLGFLGSLNRCELSLERQRMADGVWVNLKQVLLVHARKFASTVRFRSTDESSGFKKEMVAQQQGG